MVRGLVGNESLCSHEHGLIPSMSIEGCWKLTTIHSIVHPIGHFRLLNTLTTSLNCEKRTISKNRSQIRPVPMHAQSRKLGKKHLIPAVVECLEKFH